VVTILTIFDRNVILEMPSPLHRANPAQEGGLYIMFNTLFISVVAGIISGIISYYVCKWLDTKFGGK